VHTQTSVADQVFSYCEVLTPCVNSLVRMNKPDLASKNQFAAGVPKITDDKALSLCLRSAHCALPVGLFWLDAGRLRP
jgi:hypothetical protein